YPPPGCVKSKKKLKPEQDGVSKSHRLLRRTCSSTVKPEMDGCVGNDPRMEQHQPLKQPHRLLPRPCSTAVKPEDCPPLRPHKLASLRTRCWHPTGSWAVPARAARSYSSSTKMGKNDIFKEPVTESRRLSLTSGLIGILAPSLSSTPQ
ncbi:hypothetical protein M9458_011357, partial [Cirrhinus mrigala]